MRLRPEELSHLDAEQRRRPSVTAPLVLVSVVSRSKTSADEPALALTGRVENSVKPNRSAIRVCCAFE